MSFWNDCPGPHWSDWFWSAVSCSGIPLAQPIRRNMIELPIQQKKTVSYYLAKPNDSSAIVEFLSNNFRITEKSVCCLPVERLARGLQLDWIAVIAKEKDVIIGIVISRFLGSLVFQSVIDSEVKHSKFTSADYIDFFCVAPSYRKTGVGSELLKYIDYHSTQKGRPIHFFQKELSPLSTLPPLWYGNYIFREILQHGISNPRVETYSVQKKRSIQNTFTISFINQKSSQDSKYYIYDNGNFKLHLAITNTYHMYQNSWLGEVLFYSVEESDDTIQNKNIAAAIEEVIEAAGYKYILMDESIPHLKQFNWIRDAPYFLYAYNVNPRKFFSVKPELWF